MYEGIKRGVDLYLVNENITALRRKKAVGVASPDAALRRAAPRRAAPRRALK